MTDLHDAPEEETASEQPVEPVEIDPSELTVEQRLAVTIMEEICAVSGQVMRPAVRSIQGNYLSVELIGEDVRSTWGRLGQSLDALQFLSNLILSQRGGGGVRLMLDADNYRQRRTDALTQRAHDLAQEVKDRNEEAELEPLPAHERRIIHSALVDDPDIMTYSEGDEPARRVVISPRR